MSYSSRLTVHFLPPVASAAFFVVNNSLKAVPPSGAAVRRVALFGTESTGKSVLAAELAAHFAEPWSEEYVRQFWDEHQGRIVAADLDAIARGQIANEEAAAARARRVVFCDTDLLTNVLWADLLFPGHCPEWVREEAERRARGYSLYLLCDTDLPWAEDPQRSFPDPTDRERLRARWRRTLEERQLPFVDIIGAGPARLSRAVTAVEQLLHTPG
jgi:HTH-type transcriptional regulator, transcriptional repressor of NAD biosynthesis genes